MNYLLLTDPKFCPSCRRNGVPSSLPAKCRCCDMWLFKATDSILRFEEDTGWREYWVWTGKDKGWMHSTQVKKEMALERELRQEKLPDNYGTEEYLKQKVADSRMELRDALKRKKKIGIPHK